MRQVDKPLDQLTLEIYRLLENTDSLGVMNAPMSRLVEHDLKELVRKYRMMNSLLSSIETSRRYTHE